MRQISGWGALALALALALAHCGGEEEEDIGRGCLLFITQPHLHKRGSINVGISTQQQNSK